MKQKTSGKNSNICMATQVNWNWHSLFWFLFHSFSIFIFSLYLCLVFVCQTKRRRKKSALKWFIYGFGRLNQLNWPHDVRSIWMLNYHVRFDHFGQVKLHFSRFIANVCLFISCEFDAEEEEKIKCAAFLTCTCELTICFTFSTTHL